MNLTTLMIVWHWKGSHHLPGNRFGRMCDVFLWMIVFMQPLFDVRCVTNVIIITAGGV